MSGWQPIETAPKDGRRVLLVTQWGVVGARWDDDRFSKYPKPYWRTDFNNMIGIRWERAVKHRVWHAIPEPPPAHVLRQEPV